MTDKPEQTIYGISPAMQAIPHIKAWNALPANERAEASARWVEQRIKQNGDEAIDQAE